MKTELRARASLEQRALTAAEKSAGYLGALRGEIPFNSDSVMLTKRGRAKPFIEQIAPEAFARSLAEDRDIMVNAGHTDDPLAALARIGQNLTVTADARSLRWEALLPDTRAASDLLKLVDQGIIRGTSFEFELRSPAGEKWETRDSSLDQRTITDARLIAFNPVTWPAYTDSSLTVELRRRDDRSAGFYSDVCCDPAVSADVAYAVEHLGSDVCELCESLEYLRENPSGAHVAYATQEVADCTASIATLTAWLAANGATPPPDLMQRSATALTAAAALTAIDYDRPRRARLALLSC